MTLKVFQMLHKAEEAMCSDPVHSNPLLCVTVEHNAASGLWALLVITGIILEQKA